MNRFICAAWLIGLCAGAHAAAERIEVSSRSLEGGKRALVPVLIDAPERVERVLIDLPAGTGRSIIVVDKTGSASYGYATRPIARVRESLKAAGIALVTVAAPSDLESGFTRRGREDSAHAKDVAAVIGEMAARFPGKPVYLAGYAEAAFSVLLYAIRGDSRVAGYVLLGGVLQEHAGGSGGAHRQTGADDACAHA